MFTKTYTRQAAKALRKIPEPYRKKILSAIAALPDGKDIKKLKGVTGYRMRISDWRIIYDIHHDQLVIEVIKIAPRGEVYKH